MFSAQDGWSQPYGKIVLVAHEKDTQLGHTSSGIYFDSTLPGENNKLTIDYGFSWALSLAVELIILLLLLLLFSSTLLSS